MYFYIYYIYIFLFPIIISNYLPFPSRISLILLFLRCFKRKSSWALRKKYVFVTYLWRFMSRVGKNEPGAARHTGWERDRIMHCWLLSSEPNNQNNTEQRNLIRRTTEWNSLNLWIDTFHVYKTVISEYHLQHLYATVTSSEQFCRYNNNNKHWIISNSLRLILLFIFIWNDFW